MSESISWLEKYRPLKFSDYLGNVAHIETITDWITNFKTQEKDFLILYGIPGIGKTTLAYLIFNTFEYEIVEINSSDYRTKKVIHSKVGALNGRSVVLKSGKSGKSGKSDNEEYYKTGLIMDEIDGITTYTENSGIQELQNIVTKNNAANRYPVICTCNSVKNKKIKDLEKHAIVIRLEKPTTKNLLTLTNKICKRERIKLTTIEKNYLINSCLEYRELINKLYQVKLQQYTYNDKSKDVTGKMQNILSSTESQTDKEVCFIDTIPSKLKYILLNNVGYDTITNQIELTSNVFVLNLYVNIIKITGFLKNEIGTDTRLKIIQIISDNLVNIDKYHNQLFINHYWDLNDYMVYEALASLLILKHNIHFFNKKINKISFSNTNFILDHHNTFNQMSQSQSSMKKKRKTTNLKNTINSVQSAYYISLMNAHSVNNIKHHKKQQKLQEKQNKAKKTKQIKQSKKQNGKSGINETAIQKSVNEPMAILLKQFNGDELIQNCDKIYEKMNGLLG
jgi:DNA polymerase III delta prime subunit